MTDPTGHVAIPGLPEEESELVLPPATPSRQQLDTAMVRGIAWTASGKWITQIAGWASTLFVARILMPSDYGLVGMAALYLGLVTLISEFGIGSAVVTLRDLSENAIAQLHTLAVLVGWGMLLVSWGLAYPLSQFFRTAALIPVVLVLSVAFPISAFRSVPNALLQRDFRFRTLALIDSVRGFLAAGAAVSLALFGLHYWTLVLSNVFGEILATILTLRYQRSPFAMPRFGTIRSAITMSRHLLVGRVSWYVYSNADFLVAGRVLGPAALGAYEFAWNLANTPIEKVTSLLSGITPSLFAAVQDDAVALKRYLLSLTEGVAIIAFPISAGLALVSGDLVPIVLGAKWAAAAVPLQLLAVYTGIRSVMPLIPIVLTVKRKTRFLMYHGIASAICFPIAFLIGSRHGPTGIAEAWVVLYPLAIVPLLYMTFRHVLPGREYLRALRPALVATLTLSAVVLVMRYTIPTSFPVLARVAAQVAVGASVYMAVILLGFPSRLRAFRNTLQAAR